MISLTLKENDIKTFERGLHHLSKEDASYFQILNLNLPSNEKELDTLKFLIEDKDVLKDDSLRLLSYKITIEDIINFHIVALINKDELKDYQKTLTTDLGYFRNRLILNDKQKVMKILDVLDYLSKDEHVRYLTCDLKENINLKNRSVIEALFERYYYNFDVYLINSSHFASEEFDTVTVEVSEDKSALPALEPTKEKKTPREKGKTYIWVHLKKEYIWLIFTLIFTIIAYFSMLSAQTILSNPEGDLIGWIFIIAFLFGNFCLLYTSYDFINHYERKNNWLGLLYLSLIIATIHIISFLASFGLYYLFVDMQVFSNIEMFEMSYLTSSLIVFALNIIFLAVLKPIGDTLGKFIRYLMERMSK